MNSKNWPAAEGYEQLTAILQAAHNEAAYGKGKERHANNLPFHEQRMQTISGLVGGTQGMAFQAIKKLTEGLQFTDHDRRERELLGAINYIAGILVFYRNQLEGGSAQATPADPADWEAGEARMGPIGQNGNDGSHHYTLALPEGTIIPESAHFVVVYENGQMVAHDLKPVLAQGCWHAAAGNQYIGLGDGSQAGLYERMPGDIWVRVDYL